ncbi:MAG: T9SS type A sorting domain-containing protein, partial [Cytophagales bacterium]|nr:T9SS type A sorting domain-containing protein [Cytophagales bacterium]
LQKTGRDKVILVGHSMGGPASREYIQNSINWQSDGKHHVAKLYTIATPHGGSNATLANIKPGNNEKSEAVRDLRYSYFWSGSNGVYLFGGNESYSVMEYSFNNWGGIYENVDVNCNGYTGEYINGLVYKTCPNDIYYSCTIGDGSALGGDAVVAASRADMNNYMSYQPPLLFSADTFMAIRGWNDIIHNDLPKDQNYYVNAKGLDEPYNPDLAYEIAVDSLYYGSITYPSKANALLTSRDIDVYKIKTSIKGNLRIQINNIPVNDFIYAATNISYTSSIRAFTGGKGSIDTVMNNLLPDDYYFFISGAPTTKSFYFPYSFKLLFTPTTNIVQQPISQTICGGNFATFSVSVTGIGPFSYNWNNGNTNSSLTTSILGNYFVTVSGLNGTVVSNVATLQNLNCVTVSAPIIVRQPTSQTVCGGTFATFTVSVSGLGSMSYNWNNGSSNSSLVTSTPGIYFVTVTGVNGKAFSDTATLTNKNCIVTQINTTDISQLEVNVYPNPSENELTVSISKLGDFNTIELFNELGLSVQSIKSAESSQKLDLRNLSKGFYVLSVQIDNQFWKIKIIKE